MEKEKSSENYIKNYEEIIKDLVNSSFLSLRKKRIKIYESNKIRFSAQIINYILWYTILVHPRLRKASKRALIGIFSHELSHGEIWLKRGLIKTEFINTVISFSAKKNKIEEEKTDIYSILKGHGEDLLEYKNWRWNLNDKDIKSVGHIYIDPKKTEKYVRSINKLQNFRKVELMDHIIKNRKLNL